jgi:glycosyltransferase involved in cell wall biosynthesis
VVSTTPSLTEVVGDAGLAVEATDSASLARALAEVLGSRERARRMAEEGLGRVQRFTWENAAEALEKVFFEVLAGDEPQPG